MNVQINIGDVFKEVDKWDPEMGVCPKPGVATLRTWTSFLRSLTWEGRNGSQVRW
jgi:CO dehydrogenase/acetyl-CoA synthase alpha subunit